MCTLPRPVPHWGEPGRCPGQQEQAPAGAVGQQSAHPQATQWSYSGRQGLGGQWGQDSCVLLPTVPRTTLHCRIGIRHTYMIHVAMSPVLHVKGCRTLLGISCLVVWSVCPCGFPSVHCTFCPLYFITPSDALTFSSSSLSVLFAGGLA